MVKGKFFYLAIGVVCLISSGCGALLVGAAVGGVGMYAASNDAIQGETDRSYDSIWNACVKVAGIRGTINKQDKTSGVIELNADSSKVWIRVIRLTEATTRLRVAARRFKLPNLSLAQDIYLKIVEEAGK